QVGMALVQLLLGLFQTDRVGWCEGAASLDERNRRVLTGFAPDFSAQGRLTEGLVEADPNANPVKGSEQAQADGGKPRIQGCGCNKKVLRHGGISLRLPGVRRSGRGPLSRRLSPRLPGQSSVLHWWE